MVEDKYIGLGLAVSSSLAIGTSFIITKKGLNDAANRDRGAYSAATPYHTSGVPSETGPAGGRNASDDLAYLRNPIWWAGMATMVVGEIANFAAYTFAPAILVTPLGALSVIIGAVLASVLLNEKLGRLGVCGCASCLIGSVIIILHAPADPDVQTVDEILEYAMRPAFMFYVTCVGLFATYMIYQVVPKYGTKNPMVYLSICSLVGSVSVMAIKGFGIALKLTFAGNNQLTHAPTYLFGLTVVFCILIQMNYFNKALDTFSTNVVNPIYYVFFSTSTIIASAILFQGFNTTSGSDSVSLLCGFLVIFMGVYLLNISRQPEVKHHSAIESGIINPRMSMSGRPSMDAASTPLWGGASASYNSDGLHEQEHGRRSHTFRQQNSTLFNAFEEEESVGLRPLREDFEEDEEDSDDVRGVSDGHASDKDLTRINTNTNRGTGHSISRARDASGARF
ncbi:hypothetical protein QFC22_004045 [Naganishia vaughanmartiniae]|uniref:Uncharacterized protein n=1 Tax=Naganishia vaughanmartiniae TaxID=1424756 RepID=A0ACC2X5W0_9TREE|nr:hypothetical protein QFC22_004045 [Naganishia vaughanmartiniae]